VDTTETWTPELEMTPAPAQGCLAESPRNSVELYVATSLVHWQTEYGSRLARDVQVNDTVYRQLDPEYFAWLRSKMTLAKMAHLAGRLAQEDYNEMCNRFNHIQEWAIRRFGEDVLLAAARNLDGRRYQSPPPVMDPPKKRPEQSPDSVLEQGRAEVEKIREEAISLGWREELLLGGNSGKSPRPGRLLSLVDCLRRNSTIGQVTRESIEIVLSSGVRQRFYNPDVEQPWVRQLR